MLCSSRFILGLNRVVSVDRLKAEAAGPFCLTTMIYCLGIALQLRLTLRRPLVCTVRCCLVFIALCIEWFCLVSIAHEL